MIRKFGKRSFINGTEHTKRLLIASFIITGACVLGVAALFGGSPTAPASEIALDTTSSTHVLFLDMQELESLHNIELVVNQAEKHPANPVLPTGDLNDFDFHQASSWGGTVI